MTNPTLLLKRSVKTAASFAKAGFGIPRTAAGSVNIIAYHRVVADIEKAEQDAIYGIVVSTETFRRHCEKLSRAFDVVSLETAMHFMDNRRKVARPMAVITFDDGYADFYDQAFPVLNELGLPATIFLPTDYIGQTKPLAHDRIFWLLKIALENSVDLTPALTRSGIDQGKANSIATSRALLSMTNSLVYLRDGLRETVIAELETELDELFDGYPAEYQLLNWDMVREMSRKGINFGSHTANHVVLPLETKATIKSEIARSKKTLEKEIGKKTVSFAYPNGEYNAAIKELTAQAGFSVAVTTEKRVNSTGADLFTLGRTSLCEESTRGLSGNYAPAVANLRLGI